MQKFQDLIFLLDRLSSGSFFIFITVPFSQHKTLIKLHNIMNFSICPELLKKLVRIHHHIMKLTNISYWRSRLLYEVISINCHSTRKLIRVKYYDFDMCGSDFQFNETNKLIEIARIVLRRNINNTIQLFVLSFENWGHFHFYLGVCVYCKYWRANWTLLFFT